jgi:beta-lactam-binding protein with PASTA domain
MAKDTFFSLFRERSWRGFLLNLLTMGLLAVLLALLLFFVVLPRATSHGETITVPDLEGMHLDDMSEFLGKRSFRYEVADSGYSSIYPPLTILKQYPRPGKKVKQNRKIYLTVKAKMPQSVKMPNLIDGSLKNAELILSSYGLRMGSITYKPDLASNAVLEQQFEGAAIEPGTTIPKGSVIDLVVGDGLGNRIFEAPNFLGLDVEEATFSIVGSGLSVGLLMVTVPDEDELLEILNNMQEMEGGETRDIMSTGHVYKQSPDIGKEIRIGEEVHLWLYSKDSEDSLALVESLEIRELGKVHGDTTEF